VNYYRASDYGLVLWIQRAKDKIYHLFAINVSVMIGKGINMFAIGDQNQAFWLFRQGK
jgi:hypothetical protein